MGKWRKNFEEEEGGRFHFSEVPLRIAVCKCSWMAWSAVLYGGCLFWGTVLLFQITPPWVWRDNKSLGTSTTDWIMWHKSALLGVQVGFLAMVALVTFLVPTLIMTWITALVFEYVFGRGCFGRPQRLIEDGSMIAKDISLMAIKSAFKEAYVVAVIVAIICFLTYGS